MLLLDAGAALLLDGVWKDGTVMEVAPLPFANSVLVESVADGLLLAVDGDFGTLSEHFWREDVSVLLASWQTPARAGVGRGSFEPFLLLMLGWIVVSSRTPVIVGG